MLRLKQFTLAAGLRSLASLLGLRCKNENIYIV